MILEDYAVIAKSLWNTLLKGLINALSWEKRSFAVHAKHTATHLKCGIRLDWS